MLNPGDKAPEFSLFNTEKEKINLSNFLGKNVVLFFFPMAFTGTCAKEMCIIDNSYEEYKNLDAEVVGISVDSLYALKQFKEFNNISTLTFLSDFNKKVIELYDVVFNSFPFEYEKVSKRATFIIDAVGYIKYTEVLEDPAQLPNFEIIKNILKK
jgi:peroxiredoxin